MEALFLDLQIKGVIVTDIRFLIQNLNTTSNLYLFYGHAWLRKKHLPKEMNSESILILTCEVT